MWNFKSHERIRTLTGFDDLIDAKALAFSPDSQLLVAKGGRHLRRWRVGDWVEVGGPLNVETNWNFNNAVAFSSDGLTLATRMPGDLKDWHELTQFQAHAGYFCDLAFSPDRKVLATCGDEHAIQMWRVEDLLKGARSNCGTCP